MPVHLSIKSVFSIARLNSVLASYYCQKRVRSRHFAVIGASRVMYHIFHESLTSDFFVLKIDKHLNDLATIVPQLDKCLKFMVFFRGGGVIFYRVQ